jgi:hypothetical protein
MKFLRGERRSGRAATGAPTSFAHTLAQYGQWQFDPQGSGIDPSRIGDGNIEYELFVLAQPDHDAFISMVVEVSMDSGGWALYGGERAVWNSVGTDVTRPDYLEMMDRAIAFLLAQGYGMAHIPPYMVRRYQETQGPASPDPR